MNQTLSKTAGIAVDNYKLKTFKKTLKDKGFEIIKTVSFTKGVKVIKVKFPVDRLFELQQTIKSLEVLFKKQN